ncbi:MAG: PRC-barrel domain-containing protein [Pirellulales bacterium]
MRIASLLSVLLLAGTCWAQQGVEVQAPGVRVQTNTNGDHAVTDRSAPNHYATTQDLGQKRIVRASELIGLNVKNNADETVGEINDIVIDPNDGRVRYVALSVGGFLGIADQLFAIPWASFECRREGDQHVVVLNVDKETLKKAKGFNEEHWPDMANPQWQTENDRFYGTPRSTDVRANRPTDLR